MKKALCLLLALALAASLAAGLAGCDLTRNVSEPKTSLLIGVTVYDMRDAFISVMMDRFKKYARELEQEYQVTITIQHEGAGSNQITQNTQVEGFIEAGCDILCVNLVDRTEASVIIEKGRSAGIPIIFFNRELVEDDLERWDKLYYVGAPAEESGTLQGEVVAGILAQHMDEVDKNGDGIVQYVMLEGEAGHQDAIVRTEKSIATLMDAGYSMQRLAAETANWVREQADAKMSSWLLQYDGSLPSGWTGDTEEDTPRPVTHIEVVFANNDEMALGALDALAKSALPPEDWPVVVGIDGTPDGLQAVQSGLMAGTVLNDAIGQAEAMLDLSWALAFNRALPEGLADGKYIRLPYRIVDASNVREFQAMYE